MSITALYFDIFLGDKIHGVNRNGCKYASEGNLANAHLK